MSNTTLFERQISIRAIPPKELDYFLDTKFKFWLANLLGLKEDKEDAYDSAKDAIKDQCIGMGFAEIKKMFEMYVDSKLSMKPIPNYFDRILLGKIVSEYKSLKKPKQIEEKVMSEDEKEMIMLEAVDRIKREVKHNGTIESSVIGVYMYLYGKGLLPPHTPEFKQKYQDRAIPIAKANAASKARYSLDDHQQLVTRIKLITEGKGDEVKNIAKRLILIDYFKTIL